MKGHERLIERISDGCWNTRAVSDNLVSVLMSSVSGEPRMVDNLIHWFWIPSLFSCHPSLYSKSHKSSTDSNNMMSKFSYHHRGYMRAYKLHQIQEFYKLFAERETRQEKIG